MDKMHLKIIVKTVNSFSMDSVERDELMSDCFLAYCQKFLPRKKEANNEFALLKTIATTTCLDFLKRKQTYNNTFMLQQPSIFEWDEKMTYELQLEDRVCLKTFLDSLNEKDLSLLKLIYEEETYETIAALRGLSVSGIKCGINKFRKRLQRKVVLSGLNK
jgi:RNA polymerase sigma factor (sigma-70 family)